MARVIHFEVPADDPEALSGFYVKVFGWQTLKAPGPMEYWMASTGKDGPGIDGGFVKRRHPQQPMANMIDVTSVDESLEMVIANGGKVTLPKTVLPGIGWLAYFADPEGNIFGIMQFDPWA